MVNLLDRDVWMWIDGGWWFSHHLQAREFANELRASTKASRNPTVWLEASANSNQSVNNTDTSTVSEAYSKMLTIFIPLLVDEVILFYSQFLVSYIGASCFMESLTAASKCRVLFLLTSCALKSLHSYPLGLLPALVKMDWRVMTLMMTI